jgi:hypothetical protein
MNPFRPLRTRFLLAKLQVDHVIKPREPRERLRALETVPKDVHSAYDEVIKTIRQNGESEIHLALKILSWVFRVQRPLRIEELLEALVIEDGDRDLERDCMLNPNEVIDCCKSLILHDESSGFIRFAHYTVEEFIEHHLQPVLPPIDQLVKTCLTYLGFDEFRRPCSSRDIVARVENYQFSVYAAQYWAFHCAGEVEESLDLSLVAGALGSQDKRDAVSQMEKFATSKWRDTRFSRGQTLVHFLAEKGLAIVCRRVLNHKEIELLTYAIMVRGC